MSFFILGVPPHAGSKGENMKNEVLAYISTRRIIMNFARKTCGEQTSTSFNIAG